mmetsp:Transcript_13334/g.33362  ORF Transcript_13334/g.33362 Transcript_13334/m.33362 type:complete len:265 (+) Transcript_13334:645-1439(+)
MRARQPGPNHQVHPQPAGRLPVLPGRDYLRQEARVVRRGGRGLLLLRRLRPVDLRGGAVLRGAGVLVLLQDRGGRGAHHRPPGLREGVQPYQPHASVRQGPPPHQRERDHVAHAQPLRGHVVRPHQGRQRGAVAGPGAPGGGADLQGQGQGVCERAFHWHPVHGVGHGGQPAAQPQVQCAVVRGRRRLLLRPRALLRRRHPRAPDMERRQLHWPGPVPQGPGPAGDDDEVLDPQHVLDQQRGGELCLLQVRYDRPRRSAPSCGD